MGIPKKALREKSLTKEKLISGEDSSHETWLVRYIEDNELKCGFFKKLEPEGHFPELLAKMSVATSAFKAAFQGSRSAKEYLVFDDNDKIVGILSGALKDFKRFNFAYEDKPVDGAEKEQVIPSKQTLIEHNTMETLFGRLFLGDDDPHPHNLGLKGDIDFDMFWYWFVIYMKGTRPGIDLPKNRVNLTVPDYERFPCVKDSMPYHWPTYTHPGQESITSVLPDVVQKPLLSATLPRVLPKVYAAPDQFASLAADPIAQEQKVMAALKIILTYQPEVLKKRLTDLFDDLTLNYTALPPLVRAKYEEEFPHLCNEKTNKEPFVDFMMGMYQQHYDNLYRVVVFYMGCENNGFGVPLLATSTELYKKPSFYKNIAEWVRNENETTYANEPENQANIQALKNRYHQTWRDSYTSRLKVVRDDAINLTSAICKLATQNGKIEKPASKEISDESLTCALQLFGSLENISVNAELCVDDKTPLYRALTLLVEFTNKFQQTVKHYYEKKCSNLTDADNHNFVRQLEQLCSDYEYEIMENLAHITSNANEFVRIIRELKQCVQQANFKVHLLTTDEQMRSVHTAVDREVLPLTHSKVIKQYKEAFFQWADYLPVETFNQYIVDIINKKYAPTMQLLSTRKRAQPVKDYVFKSSESNSNKLAYILGSSADDEGALNTEVVRELTPIMLQTNYMPSVISACKDGRFEQNITIFVKAVASFARGENDKGVRQRRANEFIHLYSDKGIELFFETMYEWVGNLPPYKREMVGAQKNRLTLIVDEALKKYEANLYSIWSSSRKEDITTCFRDKNSRMALALTFIDGSSTSTASQHLFIDIVNAIKQDILKNPGLKKDPGYNLINSFLENENKHFYFEQLKKCAITEKMSHYLETKPKPSKLSEPHEFILL